ncbi:MAG: hypothetical protein NTU57_02600 [Candidatus Aenigmarchaeota archaeon]|nr:hypothetical protein [Candidatus Aenigmarchaeota archaeon]
MKKKGTNKKIRTVLDIAMFAVKFIITMSLWLLLVAAYNHVCGIYCAADPPICPWIRGVIFAYWPLVILFIFRYALKDDHEIKTKK